MLGDLARLVSHEHASWRSHPRAYWPPLKTLWGQAACPGTSASSCRGVGSTFPHLLVLPCPLQGKGVPHLAADPLPDPFRSVFFLQVFLRCAIDWGARLRSEGARPACLRVVGEGDTTGTTGALVLGHVPRHVVPSGPREGSRWSIPRATFHGFVLPLLFSPYNSSDGIPSSPDPFPRVFLFLFSGSDRANPPARHRLSLSRPPAPPQLSPSSHLLTFSQPSQPRNHHQAAAPDLPPSPRRTLLDRPLPIGARSRPSMIYRPL